MRQKKKRKKVKIKPVIDISEKLNRYFLRNIRRRYKKKYKSKVKRHYFKKAKKHVANIFNYPDRKIQPIWVSKKIKYILSYFKMYKTLYRKNDKNNLLNIFKMKNLNLKINEINCEYYA